MAHHFAYCTVIFSAQHASRLISLAHSLRKHASPFPLLVLLSPTLSPHISQILHAETSALQITLLDIPADYPSFSPHLAPLYAFSPLLFEYEMLAYLDPSIVITRRGLDLVFADAQLPADTYIGAPFACTCGPQIPWKGKARWDAPVAAAAEPPVEGRCPRAGLPRRKSSVSWIPPGSGVQEEKEVDVRMMVFYPGERVWEAVTRGVGEGGVREVVGKAIGERWGGLPEQYFGGEGCRFGEGHGRGVIAVVREGSIERVSETAGDEAEASRDEGFGEKGEVMLEEAVIDDEEDIRPFDLGNRTNVATQNSEVGVTV